MAGPLRPGFRLPMFATVGLIACAGVAAGQDAAAISALERLHAEVAAPGKVLSVEQGQAALQRLDGLGLSLETLAPPHQQRWLQTAIHIALAIGDARQATERLTALRQVAPDARETLEAAYLIACAAGDAKLGYDVLGELRKLVDPERRKVLAQRRRGFRKVGTRAADITVQPEGGGAFALAERRGVVLVVDFWNLERKRTDGQGNALKALNQQYADELAVRLVGVCTERKTRDAEAREFATESAYDWPQQFTGGTDAVADAAMELGLGTLSGQVIISALGHIRTVGDASEPAFQYALRAAIAEAAGRYVAVLPRTLDGQPVGLAEGGSASQTAAGEAKSAPPPPKEELKHSEEAEALLRQARLYLKSGRKQDAKKLLQEIIDKYPGTKQAEEAKWRIEGL